MEENQENNKFHRISKITAGFMIVVAFFYGSLEFGVDWIPGIGQVLAFFVDLFGTMHFALWFTLKGVNLGSPKSLARFWAPVLLGWLPIPLIDAVLIPIGVILTIGFVWAEDLIGLKVPSSKKGLKSKIIKR